MCIFVYLTPFKSPCPTWLIVVAVRGRRSQPGRELAAIFSSPGSFGILPTVPPSFFLPPPPSSPSLQHSVSAASKARVTGLSWSRPDPGLLLSADDSGALVVWDLLANITRAVVFGRNTIFCLAAHPEVRQGCTTGLRKSLSGRRHRCFRLQAGAGLHRER